MTTDGIPEVDQAGAKLALEEGKTLFVDVRDPGSFAEAHIPGARYLHDGNVQEFVESADKSAPVIVYCYHGNTSLGGTNYLKEQGFQDVRSMQGGFEEWRLDGTTQAGSE